jgi:hypothetical protein
MAPREGESPTSSSELDYLVRYPPEVVQRLQVIITRLAGNAHYERCIDAYEETRGGLCDESLQVSQLRLWMVLFLNEFDLRYWIISPPFIVGQILHCSRNGTVTGIQHFRAQAMGAVKKTSE